MQNELSSPQGNMVNPVNTPSSLCQIDPALLFAISGHRWLADPDAVKKQCEPIFDTSRKQGTLLTGLAEGSDQLVAEIALDSDWRVEAILPMPLAEYEKDFINPDALFQFRKLLTRCHRVIEIPLTATVDSDIQAISTSRDGVILKQQYRNLGRYLVEHAQTMLLLWDGDASAPKPGGTAEVKLMCDTALERWNEPNWSGIRRVIHIPVQRTK